MKLGRLVQLPTRGNVYLDLPSRKLYFECALDRLTRIQAKSKAVSIGLTRLVLMKRVTRASHLAICLTVFCALVAAQKPVASDAKPQAAVTATDARFFPLDELRPGMKGVAYTVFSGTEPQEFWV